MNDSIPIKKEKPKIIFKGSEIMNFLIRGIFDLTTITPRPGTLVALSHVINSRKGIERQAFDLINKSIVNGIAAQLKDIQIDPVNLQKKMSTTFSSKEYDLPHTIFNQPENAPFIDDLANLYRELLSKTLSEASIDSFVMRFPVFFGDALLSIVQQDQYKELLIWAGNPIINVISLRLKRKNYQAEIAQMYFKKKVKINDREIGISNIYCEPSFLKYDTTNEFVFQEKILKSPENYLKKDFLYRSDRRILIILGLIGSGKTLFCLKSIKALQEDSNVITFYIQLKDINKNTILTNSAFDVFTQILPTETQPAKWIANSQKKSVFFLDGLDEMSMENGISDDEIIKFLGKCQELIINNPNSFIVITSRPNFIKSSKLHHANRELVLLKTQTVSTNWDKYINPEHKNLITIIGSDIEFEYIQELTKQPFWAQTLNSKPSKTEFYNILFEELLNRPWDETKKNSKFKYNLSASVFKQLISYIAFLQLKSHEKHILTMDLNNDPKINDFISKILKIAPANVNQSLNQILTSFYFEEVRLNNDSWCIKFSHKKLYLYLACEYIWEQLCDIYIIDVTSSNADSIIKRTKELFANIEFTDEINSNLLSIVDNNDDVKRSNLVQGMRRYANLLLENGFMKEYKSISTPKITPDQKILNTFYGFNLILGALEHKALEHKDSGIKNANLENNIHLHFEKEKKAKEKKDDREGEIMNSEQRALFQNIIKNHNIIKPEFNENLRESFRLRLLGRETLEQKVNASSKSISKYTRYIRLSLATNHPKKLDLSYLDFESQDIRGLYGIKTNFKGANFFNATLKDSNLSESNLEHTILSLASLENANLREANFKNSILNFVNLRLASLVKSNFQNAWLFGANFSLTSSSYCSLTSAYLDYSNLSDSDFRNANFQNASLAHSNLSNADFTNVKFNGANMHGVVLDDTILINAEFNDSIMTKIDFTNIDLSLAHMEGTNLEGAILRNTNLTKTIFDENTVLSGVKVLEMDWIGRLSAWKVYGAKDIQDKYQVNQKRQTFKSLDGTTWDGYLIEKKIQQNGIE